MEKRKSLLQKIQSEFDKLYYYAPIAYITLNREGMIMASNLNANELLGIPGDDNPVSLANNLLDDSMESLKLFLASVFRDERPHEIHLPIFHPDGNRVVVQGYGHRCYSDDNLCIVALLPVEERLSADENINRLAFNDQLTGLPNRALFNERIEFELKHAHRNNMNFSILFIDLDHFKYVNDTLGHEAGDKVLCEIAHILAHSLRETDLVARMGGDEFAVILRETPEAKDVAIIAKRILERVAKPILLDQLEVALGCSIGVAFYPHDGKTKEVLLKNADMAMYKAKQEGRNNYVFYNQDLREKIFKRLDMETKLVTAYDDGRLKVHYQPTYDLKDHSIIGLEALMRWEIEDRVWVTPNEFIPIAEKLGLIIPYGEWILRQACLFNQTLAKLGHQMVMSVNVSPIQLVSPNYVDTVLKILADTNMPPSQLELEINETALTQEGIAYKDILLDLSNAGVQLTLDDFGTGNSSLTYLYDLPLNRIKIDRSFISQCYNDENKKRLVQLVIRLGYELLLNVTASGVETNSELAFLEGLGCTNVQGYLLAKPQSSQDILKEIQSLPNK